MGCAGGVAGSARPNQLNRIATSCERQEVTDRDKFGKKTTLPRMYLIFLKVFYCKWLHDE
jgi:hypothetical protein